MAAPVTGVIDIQAIMAGACSMLGGSAADTLTGSNSNDVINGGAGADIIDGQDGEDTLTGGAGADTFYTVAGDQSTTPSSSIYTTITDFESDSDIIDDTAAALSIASWHDQLWCRNGFDQLRGLLHLQFRGRYAPGDDRRGRGWYH